MIWEISFGVFLVATVFLGGGAAYLTGRAMATSWSPLWELACYTVLLCAAVRFIHFSLYGGTLLSLHYYLVDLVVLAVFAWLGMRITRTGQMTTQYSFGYRRSGPVNWTAK